MGVAASYTEEAINNVTNAHHSELSHLQDHYFVRNHHDPNDPKSLSLKCHDVVALETYRQRILEKLHLKSTAEIIHYTLKNNLAD
jgi:hypothetical protein